MAVEGGITELRETAHYTQGDAGPVEQHGGFKPFGDQTAGLQEIHQTDGSLKSNGVKVTRAFSPGSAFTSGKTFSS